MLGVEHHPVEAQAGSHFGYKRVVDGAPKAAL
jgi:hypothetical protein